MCVVPHIIINVSRDGDGKLSFGDLAGAGVSAASTVYGVTKQVVNQAYQAVLNKTQDAVDFVLPAQAEANSSAVAADEDPLLTISHIRQAVTDRLKNRAVNAANAGYTELKQFSASKVEPVLHVDPVIYTEQIVRTQVEPAVAKLNEQIQSGIVNSKQQVNKAVEALSQAANLAKTTATNTTNKVAETVGIPAAIKTVQDKATEVKDQINARVTQAVPDSIKAAGPEIQLRFAKVKQASIELASITNDRLLHTGLTELPSDVLQVVSSLPNVILFNPTLNNAQDPTGILTKVEEVIAAVKNLLWWGKVEEKTLSAKERAQQLANAAVEKAKELKSTSVEKPVNGSKKQAQKKALQ
jgi:hypothetical protein